ncbi:ligand-binding domain of nuclear hormone receptor domain-containing protein [Ditylenchus destructor]|nr:ligand-binding domain of nuclear hormone receptor domain-containing protein [Ditylenchus destructor]
MVSIESQIYKIRKYSSRAINYMNESIKDVLLSGHNELVGQSLLSMNPETVMHAKDRIPSPVELLQSKKYLNFDLLMTIEYSKCGSAFKGLCLEDQIIQSRNTALPACLLLQSYFSSIDGNKSMTLPNGETPQSMLLHNNDESLLERAFSEAHTGIFHDLVTPWKKQHISMHEFAILKSIILHYPENAWNGSPNVSADAKQILMEQSQTLFKILVDYEWRQHGYTNGNRRLEKIKHLLPHFFTLASKVRGYHRLLKQVYHLDSFDAEYFEEIMRD